MRVSDPAIAALSDPPHFTAGENPTAAQFAGAPGDAGDYSRPPFAGDVSEGRADPLYNAHGYHTKIPPRAIARYLLHYTRPGDLIYDGFCGSGMTGVAAQLCGAPGDDWRARIEREWRTAGRPAPEWGARRAWLSDLSPAATFIADSFNRALSEWQPESLAAECAAVAAEVEAEVGWMFESSVGGQPARIIYTLWSEVFLCPACGGEIVYYRAAVDARAGKLRERFACPSCRRKLGRRDLLRAWDERFDPALDGPARLARTVPIELTLLAAGRRCGKMPDAADRALIERARAAERRGVPIRAIPDGDKSGDAFAVGIRHVHQLFTERNLAALAALWSRCRARGIGWLVTGIMQRASKQHQVAVSRLGPRRREGGRTAGHRRGTLYVPSIQIEFNPLALFRERARAVAKACGRRARRENVRIETCSAARSSLPDDSVDYLFVDPPFGANLQYSELNQVWEAWLGVSTRAADEAVMNHTRKKDLADYRRVMEECFRDFHRVLKRGRFLTVVFHNSDHAVWNAIHAALLAAGFAVEEVRTLDKIIKTHTQRTAARSVRQDLVITARKPTLAAARPAALAASTVEEAWQFVARHLRRAPAAERQPHLLYDRMVAHHLRRGESVPLGAPEFYAGLAERFSARGGLYFSARRRKDR